jgi:tetratricopeptide (TPR) repeat protein
MKKIKKLIEKEKYEEAIAELGLLLSTDPYNTEGLVWLAKAQFKLNEYNASIETYNKLINLLPNIADLYSDRGLCFHMAKDYKSALLDFNKAVDLEPENAYRYSCRAFVKDYYKDYQGALTDYKKAIELDPDDAITYNNKGVLEEKLGFAELAKESFHISNELQGIDLDKELSKINLQDAPTITLSEPPKKKLTLKGYMLVFRSIFTSKKGFIEFIDFLNPKK